MLGLGGGGSCCPRSFRLGGRPLRLDGRSPRLGGRTTCTDSATLWCFLAASTAVMASGRRGFTPRTSSSMVGAAGLGGGGGMARFPLGGSGGAGDAAEADGGRGGRTAGDAGDMVDVGDFMVDMLGLADAGLFGAVVPRIPSASSRMCCAMAGFALSVFVGSALAASRFAAPMTADACTARGARVVGSAILFPVLVATALFGLGNCSGGGLAYPVCGGQNGGGRCGAPNDDGGCVFRTVVAGRADFARGRRTGATDGINPSLAVIEDASERRLWWTYCANAPKG